MDLDPLLRARLLGVATAAALALQAVFPFLAERERVGHAGRMAAVHASDPSLIPTALVGDLDLDRDQDEEEWERRMMELASVRIQAARVRLERMGIIVANGQVVSNELPPDMTADSDATLETG